MRSRRTPVLLIAGVLLASCGDDPTSSEADTPAGDSPLRDAPPIEVSASAELPDLSQDPARLEADSEDALIEAARALLRQRLTDDASIELTSFARVVWPDGSLGCPQAGMAYTQALVQGYQVVLSAGGRTYHYHGRDGRQPKFCARPQTQGNWQMDR